jgi:mannose-1-phosphate guanylyltransferase/phosphomannomutase
MKIILMAGGFGLRLHPLTFDRPKALVPFINKPIINHIFDWLKRQGFTEIILTTQHRADEIEAYCGNGEAWGLQLTYLLEPTRLGTAGSVKNAQALVGHETFLVISCDLVTDIDLHALIEFHYQKKAQATIALKRLAETIQYGLAFMAADGRITNYIEKPRRNETNSNLVNAGIYVLEPSVFTMMATERVYDFSYDIFPQMVRAEAAIFGYEVNQYWCDIGTIPNYKQATIDALMGKVPPLDLGQQLQAQLWVGQNVSLAADARLQGPIYLGHEVKISPHVTIEGPTVIGDYTVVKAHAHIKQAIIGQRCLIREATQLQAIIMPDYTA